MSTWPIPTSRPRPKHTNLVAHGVARVTRIQADPKNLNRALPDSETVILGKNSVFEYIGNPDTSNAAPFTCQNADKSFVQDCVPLEATSHTLGQLLFGTDGALYVGSGDGIEWTPPNLRAQDVNSLSGKILRIDPMTGAGFADNPFTTGDLNENRAKVYALGMRNPWRFTLGPDGLLYVADVGNSGWETISQGQAGDNFGWPCYEGPERVSDASICQPLFNGERPLKADYYAYPHDTGHGAAIGGDFVRAPFPPPYRDRYFFADYNGWTINYLEETATGVEERLFATNAPGLVEMKFGPDGALYVLYILSGSLARIRYVGGGNLPPVVVATAKPESGPSPLTVAFSSAGTADPEAGALRYAWDFGDGETSSAANPSHTYRADGLYAATLRVTDASGAPTTATFQISVGNDPPQATILAPQADARYQIGDRVEFEGEGSDGDDGSLADSALQWEIFTHHNDHIHYDTFRGRGKTGRFVYEDHGDNVYLELCLTATDSTGLKHRTCVDLRPETVTLTLDSQPSGLPLIYNNTREITPFEIESYINAQRVIEAPGSAGELRFERWSDGGAAQHPIAIGSENMRLTAFYTGTTSSVTPAIPAVGNVLTETVSAPVEVAPPVAQTTSTPAVAVSGWLETEGAPAGGARILVQVAERYRSGWAVVQWQDENGDWQEIEGWRGDLKNGRARWWVSPDLYGHKPFRWMIFSQPGGTLLAASPEFAMPANSGEMLVWRVE